MTSSNGKSESISVIVRSRPMLETEMNKNYKTCIKVHSNSTIEVTNLAAKSREESSKQFTFDRVYDGNSSQEEVYSNSIEPLVKSAIEGYDSTILAYGQTGTGKTFTTLGDVDDPKNMGIIPRTFEQIFKHIQESTEQDFLIRVSYLQIYKEKLMDLLAADSNKNLEIRETTGSRIFVENLSSRVTRSYEEILDVLNEGNSNRIFASTDMNVNSSRSHCIFFITIESSWELNGETNIKIGRLNIVDLAGSERQKKTNSDQDRFKEAIKINLSLLTLGNVISSLTSKAGISHVPYRDSKLTHLLKDSFGGKSKTIVIGNVGPASFNYDETLNTLRYMARAKKIKNKPVINYDGKDGLLREYLMEIERLKEELKQKNARKSAGKNNIRTTNQNFSDSLGDENLTGDRLSSEKEATIQIQQQLFEMESKLIHSGGQQKILEKLESNSKKLAKNYEELEKHKNAEEEILEKISSEANRVGKLEENVSSLNEEVALATKRLNKLVDRFQALTKSYDIKDESYHSERREIERCQEELLREIKLKNLIIANFIPPYELKKLKSRLTVDEQTENWKIKPILECMAKDPSTFYPWIIEKSNPLVIPRSLYAKNNEVVLDNVRYKMKNIIQLDLIDSIPTVHESLPTTLPQEIVNLVNKAFDEENTSHIIDAL